MKSANYKQIVAYCAETSRQGNVIDNFLVPYAAKKNKIEEHFIKRLHPYRHVAINLPESLMGMLIAQYIVHRVFKKGGHLQEYLKSKDLNALHSEEMTYLEQAASWTNRFSFCEISNSPAPDFYEMWDVLTEEPFLMYSPSMTKILRERPVRLWFHFMMFNGQCYQSYGTIGHYPAFDVDDIVFFATELNPALESLEDIQADVESNPVPYMMLITASTIPDSAYRGARVVDVWSEHDLDHFETTQALREDFEVEYTEGVYRLTKKDTDESAIRLSAYYNEAEKTLMCQATTDPMYAELIESLNRHGFNISDEPQVRVSPAMLITLEKLLRREVRLNPYDDLFAVDSTPEQEAGLDQLNQFMQMAIPLINSGRESEVPALAKQLGVDPQVANDLLGHIVDRLSKIPGKGKR